MTDEPIDTPADLLATEPAVTVPPARVVERRDVPDEPIDLDAAQALCDAATPGPWGLLNLGEWMDAVISAEDDVVCTAAADVDREFLAQARTLLPDALAEIERLRSQLQATEEAWSYDKARLDAARRLVSVSAWVKTPEPFQRDHNEALDRIWAALTGEAP